VKTKNFQSRKTAALYAVTAIFLILWCVLPLLWSFSISITPRSETLISPAKIVPQSPTFESYAQLMDTSSVGVSGNFRKGMTNSIISSLGTVAIGLPLLFLGSYAVARMKFRGRKLIEAAIYSTLVIPVFATIIPLFLAYSKTKLINTQGGLILVYVSSLLPLILSVMVNYLSTLPTELEEAASIDGCSRMRMITDIILPLSYPILLSSALIMFISVWNQYTIPLILASSDKTKPIAVVISEFVTKNSTNYPLMNAGGLLAIVVPCGIAIVFRKFLAKGLTAGATKG